MQSQESFCDFVGLRIFHEAYLNAFAYLLSPNPGLGRSKDYPNMKRRVANLAKAADAFGISIPEGYDDLFIDDIDDEQLDEPKFFLSIADAAADSMVPILIESANSLANDRRIDEPNIGRIQEISDRYSRHPVPHEDPESLVNILIAAWRVYQKNDLWHKHTFSDKGTILKDLVLKNIEILEYNYIVGEQA